MTSLLRGANLDAPCPHCGYLLWFRWSEVVAQVSLICPCCRWRIWLRDADGSMHNAAASIDRQLSDLQDSIEKIARNLAR